MDRTVTVLLGLIVLLGCVRPAPGAYVDQVLADGPLAYYRLDETGGTDAFDTASAHDGTYEGGVTLGQAGPRPADGFLGFETDNAAPLFNGIDGKVALPTGFLPTGNSARTIEGWFNPDGDESQTFFTYGPNESGGRVSITADADGVAVAVGGHNYGRQDLSLAGWHHAAVVLPNGATESDEWLLYLDGAELTGLSGLAGGPKTIDTTDFNPSIGTASNNNTIWYSGLIDEVAAYDRALSAGEIQDHYEAAVLPEPGMALLGFVALTVLCLNRRRRG